MKFFSLLSVIQSALATTGTPSDPCVALCEEFSADRRGNGYDLCDDDQQSRCEFHSNGVSRTCSHLYWSFSHESGVAGLIYSVDTSDLSPEEAATPVSCQEANEIVEGHIQDEAARTRIKIFTTAMQIFVNLNTVNEWISDEGLITPFKNVLREVRSHLASHAGSLGSLIPRLNTMDGLEMVTTPVHVEQVLEQLVASAGLGQAIHMGDIGGNDVVILHSSPPGSFMQYPQIFGNRALVALVDSNHEGWIRIGSEWFRTMNNGLTRIDDIGPLGLNGITTAIYQRV